MRTAILLAGLLVSSELEHIRSKSLTKEEQELDTKFGKMVDCAFIAAIVMDVIDFILNISR